MAVTGGEDDQVFGAVMVFAFCLLVSAFSVHRSVRLWRDPDYFERTAAEFRFGGYSREFRRGIVRGWLAFTAGFVALTAFAAIYLYAQVAYDRTPTAVRNAGLSMIALMLVCEGLLLLIAWFNVPKALVPPYLRAEPGARAQRRSRQPR